MSRASIRSILVAGDGIVGLSAALAFSRALPGVEVSVLALPADPAAIADHFPSALPAVGRFHASIGFDELDLIRGGVAVHHLGTRFDGGAAGAWIHSFGEVGRNEGAIPFRQIWLGVREKGQALPFDRYSPASVIGAAGKFVHPSGDPASQLATLMYGLRLNPQRYRAVLAEASSHLTHIAGPMGAIDRREDGGIAALRLADGRRFEADLFVDCSGPSAALLGTVSTEFDDWVRWLPACHVAQSWEQPEPLAPLDRVESIEHGWCLNTTVPGAAMRASVTTASTGDSVAIRPGRRRDSFVANVLALGDAAVALDPLHGANLSIAHSAILRAIALLPGRDCHPLELAEYNRLTALETERARDFHALFQSQCPGVSAPPDSLARTLAQWRARGRLPFFEEETFTEASWQQALIGLGCLTDAVAPAASSVDGTAAATAMAAFARELDALAARLPTYPDYLARMNQAAPATRRR